VNTSRRAILLLISAIWLTQGKADETIYFLVGERPGRVVHNDSYVLPLSKQEDVDHARYLISRWQSGYFEADRPLVSAKVADVKDAINRNYGDRRFPEWSWHVVEFRSFGDFAAEILDGSPTDVENDPAWYRGEDGRQGLIGFWAYTIVRELGARPHYLSTLPEAQNLQFYWSGLGTNYFYTLEGRESLASTNWFSVPGAAWPLKTNHWTLPQTNAAARFYRVRVELEQNKPIILKPL